MSPDVRGAVRPERKGGGETWDGTGGVRKEHTRRTRTESRKRKNKKDRTFE